MTINGVTTDYIYNVLDQLVDTSGPTGTVAYTYDGRGNLDQVTTGSQVTDYTYNATDRLANVTLPDSTILTYGYDADGRRIKQTVGAQVTNYLWDEASVYGDVVLETDGSGATLASYVMAGTQLVSQTRASTTSYYLQDGQDSTRALTNAAGNVTDTYSYNAFGELLDQTGSTANSYLYTGQQFDALTGLYDLRARYYDPAIGRFLSQDSYPVNFGNPVELNRYGYTANNPINLIDPSGYAASAEFSILVFFQRAATGAALGALGGAAFGAIASLVCNGSSDWGTVGRAALTGAKYGAMGGAIMAGAGTPGLAWWLAPSIGSTFGLAGLYATAQNAGNVNGWCTLLSGLASAAAFTGSFASGFSGGPPAPALCLATCGGGGISAAASQGAVTSPGIWGTLGAVSMMSGGSGENDDGGGRTKLTLEQALQKLDESGVRPGQTTISRSRIMELIKKFDPTKAISSVYKAKDGNSYK